MLEFFCGMLFATLSAAIAVGYVHMREQTYLAYVHGTMTGVTATAGLKMLRQGMDLEMGEKPKSPNVMVEFAKLVHTARVRTC